MNTSNKEWKLYARNTETLEKLSTSTGTESANVLTNTGKYNKQQAHALLDRVKLNRITPLHLINEALATTGDL